MQAAASIPDSSSLESSENHDAAFVELEIPDLVQMNFFHLPNDVQFEVNEIN